MIQATAFPTVFSLNQSSAEANVFWLHAAGGGVSHYETMAGHLARFAKVYGLDDPALHDNFRYASVPELADYHLELIKELQPEGPYRLFGACTGGPLAYEVACQLLLRRDAVATIVMFGSHDLGGYYHSAAAGHSDFLVPYARQKLGVDLGEVDWASIDGKDIDFLAHAVVTTLVEQNVVAAGSNTELITNLVVALCLHSSASKRFTPAASNLNIDVYKQPKTPEEVAYPVDWCDWSLLTSGAVRFIPHSTSIRFGDDTLLNPFAESTASQVHALSLANHQT